MKQVWLFVSEFREMKSSGPRPQLKMTATVSEQASSGLFALVSPAENVAPALPDLLPDGIDREDFRTANFQPESFLAERRVSFNSTTGTPMN
jgi:hypothetical protein